MSLSPFCPGIRARAAHAESLSRRDGRRQPPAISCCSCVFRFRALFVQRKAVHKSWILRNDHDHRYLCSFYADNYMARLLPLLCKEETEVGSGWISKDP